MSKMHYISNEFSKNRQKHWGLSVPNIP